MTYKVNGEYITNKQAKLFEVPRSPKTFHKAKNNLAGFLFWRMAHKLLNFLPKTNTHLAPTFRWATKNISVEVVVAQLVERLLPIPEIGGSNPVIGQNLFISNICLLSTVN